MVAEAKKPVVLITGSSGLLGTRIAERLSGRYQVVGLDIKEPNSGGDLQWIECDFTDDSSVEQALGEIREKFGGEVAGVIHLAAYYDFSGEPSPMYDKLTVEGTRRLLRELQRFEHVEQLSFSSSLLVMKPCETGELLTEDSPTRAEWEYPQSKLEAEEVIEKSRGKIPAVVLRIAGVYDEGCHSIPIAQNIRRIAEKQMESYFFPGNAEHGQSFIHLEDVVDCFERVLEKRHELGDHEIFLVGEEECLSYEELQDALGGRSHGKEDWPTIRIPKAMAKAGAWVQEKVAGDEEETFIKPWMVDMADAHYPVDMTRCRDRLNWAPRHRLSQTLPAMISRLKADPRSWYEENGLPLPDEDALQRLASV